MIDLRTNKDIKEYPVLNNPKLYVYVMLNNIGKVKIGKTTNIYKRYMSLCGSNGQGNIITKLFCSKHTYLQTLEGIMHTKFDKYRIPKTEWFYNPADPTGEQLFKDAVTELQSLFSSTGYEKCNTLKKMLYEHSQDVEYDN